MRLITLISAVILASHSFAGDVHLSPANWLSDGEVPRADGAWGVHRSQALAVGRKHAIAGTSAPIAIRAGLEALNQGGSAADAVITTALGQIALSVGSWVSYAGIFQMLYFDAATGNVYNINAAYNTLLQEDDPMSIPVPTWVSAGSMQAPPSDDVSARGVLVGGFMKGVEAVHARFGNLPFATLFEPAIFIAETGFEVSPEMAGYMEWRKGVLSRLPETRELFIKADGSTYTAGESFKQLALAATLRRVSSDGADYMYRGEWAKHFVAAVQSDGGKLTTEDLERYEVIWDTPLQTAHNGYSVFAAGATSKGGRTVISALDLIRDSEHAAARHYSQNAHAFHELVRIANKSAMGGLRSTEESSGHSDAIVAVDQWGNVAAITHSINSIWWGEIGMMVDGVSIPDSASFQQAGVLAAGPGNRLPDAIEPVMILRNDKPVMAFSSIAYGLHYHTVTTLLNALDFGMDPKSAIDTPSLLSPGLGAPNLDHANVIRGDFDAAVLRGARALGSNITESDPNNAFWAGVGILVGLEVDETAGLVKAAAPLYGPGVSYAR